MKTIIVIFLFLALGLISALAVPYDAVGAEITGINLTASYQDEVDDSLLSFLKNKQRRLCPSRFAWENGCKSRNLKYINKITAQCKLGIIRNDSIEFWWVGYLDGRFNLVTSLGRAGASIYRHGEKFGRTVRLRFEARHGTQPEIRILLPYNEISDKKIITYIKNAYNHALDINPTLNNPNIKDKNNLFEMYENVVDSLLN